MSSHRPLIVFLFLGVLAGVLPAALSAQEIPWDFGAQDEARARTREINQRRQEIDDFPLEQWRNAAFVVITATAVEGGEGGKLRLSYPEREGQKVVAVQDGTLVEPFTWELSAKKRLKIKVSFYRAEQTVTCTLPKKGGAGEVLLGVFQIVDASVECFVRPLS